MGFKLGAAPSTFRVELKYPYLKDSVFHIFNRVSRAELRERSKELFGKDGRIREEAEDGAIKSMWSQFCTSVEGYDLGENWKAELLGDPEGQEHIRAATLYYLNFLAPEGFLSP